MNCVILGIPFQSTRTHCVIDTKQLKPGPGQMIQLQSCRSSSYDFSPACAANRQGRKPQHRFRTKIVQAIYRLGKISLDMFNLQ